MEKEEGYSGENEQWFQFNKRIVIRREDTNEPYLIRRTIVSFGKWFSIKYHQVVKSDDLCSHNHPWAFLTIILKGGYYEWTPIMQNDKGKIVDHRVAIDGETIEVKKWHGVGSIMYRPANWIHRLELKQHDFQVENINGNLFIQKLDPPIIFTAHTLVFTFKVIQEWGFFTKSGWIFWKNYNQKRDC